MKRVMIGFVFMLLFSMAFVSAGVGISWDQESVMVPEKTKECLTYKVYNPWPRDVYATVEVSDELDVIMKSQKSEIQFIASETSSSEAIPVTFCFKSPNIYERKCLIGNSLICKSECNEELQTFSGQVEVIEMSEAQALGGGAGGSATQMSVSAPLKVRVQCIKSGYNFSIVYLTIALIAGAWLAYNLLSSKKRKAKKKARKK